MDLSRRDVLRQVKELQSEAVKDCAESVKESNPDMDKSTAFAICQDMENQGELGALSFDKQLDEDDPCWEGYTAVGMKPDPNGSGKVPNCVPSEDVENADLSEGCPEGQVNINGECIPVEEADDVPPSVLNGAPAVMAAGGLNTQPIERNQEDGGAVRYANLELLTEGVWTDQKSRTPTLYPEDGIAEIEAEYDDGQHGPPVNVMHDVDPTSGEVHKPSHAGHVDPNSLTYHNGALTGDIVLDTSTAAGEFADENLQSALESEGRVGFGGPSVELDLDPETHIQNSDHPEAEKEIMGGWLTGLGLVMDPADNNVAFDRQTRERAVAMGDSQTDKAVYRQRTLMNPEESRETLESHGIETDDMSDEEVVDFAESLHDDLMEEMEDMEETENASDEEDEEEEEDMDMGDYEDEEEDEEEEEAEMMDEGAIQSLNEQIDDLWDAVDELKGSMMSESEKEELAAAETVEEIDKRLSEIEEEPADRKTLAEGSTDTDASWFEADGMTESDTRGL
jgi:hypothetical protein